LVVDLEHKNWSQQKQNNTHKEATLIMGSRVAPPDQQPHTIKFKRIAEFSKEEEQDVLNLKKLGCTIVENPRNPVGYEWNCPWFKHGLPANAYLANPSAAGKWCAMAYTEFFRCIHDKNLSEDEGGADPECGLFKYNYEETCPVEWTDKWDDQRAAHSHPDGVNFDPIQRRARLEARTVREALEMKHSAHEFHKQLETARKKEGLK